MGLTQCSLFTTVDASEGNDWKAFTPDTATLLLGSCFADGIGARMLSAGCDVLVNPFGTLYNPSSIRKSLERIAAGTHFTESDCVMMGAGAGLVCSFSHHTSFARVTAEEFLANANARLDEAHEFWQRCSCVILTYGTASVWKRGDETVSNCLKRPGYEFTRELLSVGEVSEETGAIEGICAAAGKGCVIHTISPIRHLGQGAHLNNLSKSTLMLGLEGRARSCASSNYFPAYEIVMDELRDYRFYADDMVHPSSRTTGIVWQRFQECFCTPEAMEWIAAKEKAVRLSAHRPMHRPEGT